MQEKMKNRYIVCDRFCVFIFEIDNETRIRKTNERRNTTLSCCSWHTQRTSISIAT